MKTILFIAAAALLAACGAGAQGVGQAIRRTPLDAAAQAQRQQHLESSEAAWADRLDEIKLRVAIAGWEGAVGIQDDDHESAARLARAYYLLADGHLVFDAARRDEFLKAHESGMKWAEHGMLAISPEYEKRRRTGAKIEDAIMKLGRDAVPLMYWWDVNLGKWAKAQDIATVLQHKDRIYRVMSRVAELWPDYFYGAPDRYFGGYFAVAPSFAGGDPQKAKAFFEASLKLAPNYIATHVLIADLLAPKLSDGRALAERELKWVLETPADIIPEVTPEATIEKKKAEKILGELDDRF